MGRIPFKRLGHNSGHYTTGVQLLVAAFLILQEGELIEFSRMEQIVGTTGRKLLSIIAAARLRVSRSHKVVVSNVRGVGYRRLDPSQIAHHVLTKDRRKARRHAWRSLARARSADRARLNPDERQQLDAATIQLGVISVMTTPRNFREPDRRPVTQSSVHAVSLAHLARIE